mgnify:CR=1 FL=1
MPPRKLRLGQDAEAWVLISVMKPSKVIRAIYPNHIKRQKLEQVVVRRYELKSMSSFTVTLDTFMSRRGALRMVSLQILNLCKRRRRLARLLRAFP